MRETVVASLMLTPDQVILPVPEDPGRSRYRVVLEGTCAFDYTGERFDALYRSGPDGRFGGRHEYLRWTPSAPDLVREDRDAHRYVFEVTAPRSQSLGMGIDVDRLVDEYLIPPSEVRQKLRSGIGLRLIRISL